AALFATGASAQPVDVAADVERVVDAARALVESLGPRPGPIEQMAGIDRRAALLHALDDENRDNWAYWPTQRVGLPLEAMSAAQRRMVHDLLLSVLSSQGHGKVINIM